MIIVNQVWKNESAPNVISGCAGFASQNYHQAFEITGSLSVKHFLSTLLMPNCFSSATFEDVFSRL